jgi:hypothetical protein
MNELLTKKKEELERQWAKLPENNKNALGISFDDYLVHEIIRLNKLAGKAYVAGVSKSTVFGKRKWLKENGIIE